MPAKNQDLHGNVPETSPVALIIVDVINDLEFEGGDALLENAIPMAKRLAALADRAREAGIPVVYVNDNFGKWRSDFRALLDHCMHQDVRGKEIAEILAPKKSDYFVLKPKHSGFFSTTLDTLLEYLRVNTVIVAGLTTDRCVLFTASDAHMRDLHIYVPKDCCAADSTQHHEDAVTMIERVLGANIMSSGELDVRSLRRGSSRE
ncbi:MAG TPA: isochorismatase family cysteine hydrolase [Gemmatimonadaceae bacterium]